MKSKQVTLILNEQAQSMINDIATKGATTSTSGIIRQAIFEYHKSLFPAYIRERGPQLSPQEKAKLKVEQENANREEKKKALLENKMKLAESVGAEIFEEGAYTYAKVKMYVYLNPHKVHVAYDTSALEDLPEDIEEKKWNGEKERIIEVFDRIGEEEATK